MEKKNGVNCGVGIRDWLVVDLQVCRSMRVSVCGCAVPNCLAFLAAKGSIWRLSWHRVSVPLKPIGVSNTNWAASRCSFTVLRKMEKYHRQIDVAAL